MTTWRPVQNFRGMHALILHGADPNRTVLERTLARLGLTLSPLDPAAVEPAFQDLAEDADIVFVDADSWSMVQPPCAPGRVPLVSMIGHETPSRLQRAFDMHPTAFLLKPVRPHGVFTSVFFAVNEHRRRLELDAELRSLWERHSARRFVTKAVLILMEQHRADDEEAFRYLRKLSMAQRKTIEDLSRQIVERAERRRRASSRARVE
jgi:two-component system, response regulator / RNA-binding antiterminator